MKRKILASILALSMIFSMVPTAAFADGETGSDSQTQIVETKKDETVGESKDKTEPGNEAPKTEEAPKADEPRPRSTENGIAVRADDGQDGGNNLLRSSNHVAMFSDYPAAPMFDSLSEAFIYAVTNALNGKTIVLIKDVTEDVVIPENLEVTIDLNGKKITNVSEHTIKNNGILTIVDNSESKTGIVDNITHGKAAVYNNVGATAILNGGTYDRTSENGKDDATSGGNSYYTIKNFGTMTVNKDVTVQTAGGNKDLGRFSSLFANGWYSYSDALAGKGEPNPNGGVATLTINGGTFNGGLNTIKNDDMGKITITGGTFTNYVQAALQNHNEAEITGGKFIAQSKYSVYNCGCRSNYDTGKLTIKDGEFTGMLASVGKFDDITISGGTFHDGIGFGADSSKNVKITGDAFADKVVAQVGDVKYVSIEAAINNAKSGETVKLVNDITGQVVIAAGKDIVFDLNGHTITHTGTALYNAGKAVIKDTSSEKTGKVVSTKNVAVGVGDNSVTTIENGTFESVEGAIITGYSCGAEININGGVFSASDNAVIAGNGNATNTNKETRVNKNVINITGGKFVGNIKSEGYIAMGIYAPWKDEITVTGGEFIVTNGAGIVARAGTVTVGGTAKFTVTGSITGNSGDKAKPIPCAAIVFDDTHPDYPALTDSSKIVITGGEFSSDKSVNNVVAINGTKTRIEVSGGSFSDNSANEYIVSGSNYEIVKNGDVYEVGKHDPKSEKVAKVEPTCTKTGTKEHYKCNTCGKLYLLNADGTYTEVTDKNTLVIDIDATNHKTKFVAEVAAGCEKDGVKAHYECERCGKLFTDAEGKNEVKAADLVIGATGHHWGEWKVVKAATTREAGIEQAICDYCGGPWQKEIPVRATASTGTATRPSNSGSTATKDNSSSSTSSTKENANPTKADTSVADVKRSDEVVSAVKENVKVADKKATVDKGLINKVKGEKGAAVVLPIASATGESVTSTEIAKDAVKAVMDNGSDLIVELTDATVKLDNETLKAVYAQAEGDSIEIRAVKTEVASLTEAQKKALDNYDTAVVVELQIYSNGKYIANFNGGIATVKIPFTPAEGVSADKYTVYYVGGDGKLTAVASEYVDGYMIISTGHFSSYAIVRTAEKVADSSSASSQPREQTGSSFPVVPVVIAVVALICLFVLLRKKNKED